MSTQDTNEPTAEETSKLSDNDLDTVAGGGGSPLDTFIASRSQMWGAKEGALDKIGTMPVPKPPPSSSIAAGTTLNWNTTKKP